MNQHTRSKLHFGPYRTPRFAYGSLVFDESRGYVRLVGITQARIPWPIGQLGRHKSPVLYKGLARAVRHESPIAIRHWWGVGPKPVARWRKALHVDRRMNEGQLRLARAHNQEPWFKHAVRRAAATKVGRPPPPHVLKTLRQARRGKPLSAQHRRRIGRSLRGPGIRIHDKPWKAWEDALLVLPMRDVVARTGRTASAIRSRRRQLRAPGGGLRIPRHTQ